MTSSHRAASILTLLRPILALACVVLLVATASLSMPSCGPPPIKKAYETYSAKLDPLLTKEGEVWSRQVDLLVPTQMERFYRFINSDGVPFYEDLVVKVAEIDPGDPALDQAQKHLEEFAAMRLEYARLTASLENMGEHYERLRGVNDAEGKMQAAVQGYNRTLKQSGNFDPRYTEVMNMTEAFSLNYMERLKKGDIQADVVETRLRGGIIDRLEALRNTRYDGDESSKALRSLVVACHVLHQQMLARLPSIEAVLTSTRRSQVLIDKSSKELETFHEVLKQVRRQF